MTQRLERFTLVDTRLVDQARDQIGRIFCPHFLLPREARPSRFRALHRSSPLGRCSANVVSYGAEVEIDPGELASFFLLQIPLAGEATVRCGTSVADTSAGRSGSLLSPTLPTRMTWFDGCEQAIILIERSAVEAHCAALLERCTGTIEFDVEMSLETPAGAMIGRHAALLLETAEQPEAASETYHGFLLDGLISLMLSGLRHSRSGELAARVTASTCGVVRLAEAWMEENAGSNFQMSDVARAAGVGLRSLQEGFRRHRGVTMSERLAEIRLARFRKRLVAAGPSETVSSLAFAAGLGHLGRAAAAYRVRYGEAPSETLRRRAG